jgi:hypothetical protein
MILCYAASLPMFFEKRIRLGFTGTRDGMTQHQRERLQRILDEHGWRIIEAHHGDCIGADEEFHDLVAATLGVDILWVHPPLVSKYRAFKQSPHILPARGYLERDRDIVDMTDALIATPKTKLRAPRSGTWYTIEYADAMHHPRLVLEP